MLIAISTLLNTGTAAGCSDNIGPSEVSCVEAANDVYVRSRNPRSQIPIWWATDMCVPYRLDHRVPGDLAPELFRQSARDAFATWEEPGCSALCFRDDGLTDKDTVVAGYDPDGDNHNVVVLVASTDDWQQRFGNEALSATIVTSSVDSGEILDADILINDASYTFVVDGECPSDQHADLQNVLTHEVGHFIGFGHTTRMSSTMYVSWDTAAGGVCEVGKRDLGEGEEAGLCTVYSGDCDE